MKPDEPEVVAEPEIVVVEEPEDEEEIGGDPPEIEDPEIVVDVPEPPEEEPEVVIEEPEPPKKHPFDSDLCIVERPDWN